jgi:hypothetical protein
MKTPTLTEWGEPQALMNNDDNNGASFLKAHGLRWQRFARQKGPSGLDNGFRVLLLSGSHVVGEIMGLEGVLDAPSGTREAFANHICQSVAQAAHHSAQLEKSLGRIAQLEGALRGLMAGSVFKSYDQSPPCWQSIQMPTESALNVARALLHPDSPKKS